MKPSFLKLRGLALISTAALCLTVFSGCSSPPPLREKPEELAKLPQWTQVVLVLEPALSLLGWAAIFWGLNGSALFKKNIFSQKKSD